jgi:3-oxoacyl-(acyl-carrier-protein) synthase
VRNLDQVDPRWESLRLVRVPALAPVRNCLINSFGLGGVNAGLLLGPPPNGGPPPAGRSLDVPRPA